MPATIVMGGQWGDEGKGKLTDTLAATADIVVRANGGANAGHTVQTDEGIFKLHLIPSGILSQRCLSIVGAGVVIDAKLMLEEMDHLLARGVTLDRLRISERAHVVLPYHPILDGLEEDGAARRLDRHDVARNRPGLQRQGLAAGHPHGRSRRRERLCALDSMQELPRWNRILTPTAYSETVLPGLEAGLIAIFQKCVHLGCRVPWCQTSQWFECPCHGSKYNRVGEKKGGPAPRGLDQFPIEVSGDTVTIDTGTVVQGLAIGVETTGQEAEGPSCV